MEESKTTLHQRLSAFVEENDLIRKGSSVVLAVSGGLDSMVMLHLFHRLAQAWDLKLTVLHVNHQLRGAESEGDQEFVQKHVAALGLPFVTQRVDVALFRGQHNLSKQEAARELRYEVFETVRLQTHSDAVATAHHADDNAETVLLNAMRGAGIRGLSGIPLRRDTGRIVRPLLFAAKEDLARYARQNGIPFREDSSNASTAYRRNALRTLILPELGSLAQTNVVESLNRVSSVMRSLQARLRDEVANRFPHIVVREENRVRISLAAFLAEPLYMREELMLEVFRHLAIEPSERKIQACLALCDGPSGRSLQLSKNWNFHRDRTDLFFAKPFKETMFSHPIEAGKEYDFPTFRFAMLPMGAIPPLSGHPATVEFVDSDRLGSDLVLRSWRPGDWFMPLGMERRKKLSDFFTDTKVSRLEKHSIPILESSGSIVWVCGKRLDQRFRVTSDTVSVARLEYSPLHAQ